MYVRMVNIGEHYNMMKELVLVKRFGFKLVSNVCAEAKIYLPNCYVTFYVK